MAIEGKPMPELTNKQKLFYAACREFLEKANKEWVALAAQKDKQP